MKKWKQYIVISLLAITLTACNAEPEVNVDNENKDGDPGAIELTTQVEGVFKGFEGNDKKSVIIEFEGQEKTYVIADDATGDFGQVKENDNIAFSTKMVDGKEMIETLRLN